MKRPNIDWGPIDAKDEDEELFYMKFVRTSSFETVFTKHIPLISGEKGSGKSAFRRFLINLERNDKAPVAEISFDQIKFASVIANLNQLLAYTQDQPLSVLTQYWRYVLVVYGMRAAMEADSNNTSIDSTVVREYLTETGIMEMGVVSLMLSLTANAVKMVDKITDPKDREDFKRLKLPSALHPQVFDNLQKYPLFDPKFVKAKDAFCRYLKKKNIEVIITLDDFDNIAAKSHEDKEKIQVIFDSLISACYQISTDKEYRSVLKIAAFLPHDRYIQADLRDFDKLEYKQAAITWTYGDLKHLVERRIQVSLESQLSFDEAWGMLFPKTVKNVVYGHLENSFDYIVRHTLYRPRHLLRILNAIETASKDSIVSENIFRRTVRNMASKNVQAFLREYAIDHPNFRAFCGRLKNFPNVCSYNDFRALVKKAMHDFGVEIDVNKKIDQLYNIGFMGIISTIDDFTLEDWPDDRYLPPRPKSGSRYECRFYYIHPDESITNSLQGDDRICIHPMFFDFCEQTADPHFIVG